MAFCLIGLGSNLGNRRAMLDEAARRIQRDPQIQVVRTSPWLETAPVGGPSAQASYFNGALVVETSLAPQRVLDVLQGIESDLGREPSERWGPRIIDLDLLLYDELECKTPSLVLPHPRMAWRRFVLEPASLVAESMVHPTTGWTIARLLEHLETALPYMAVSGSIGAGKTELARQLVRRTSARLVAERLDLRRLTAFYADPAGRAWETELEFLEQRARLLAADSPEWLRPDRLAISDFWFDQSLAFARVWLPPEQLAAFSERWQEARRAVVRPKLIVLLEASADRLLERVVRRGRPCEQRVSKDQLQQIQQAIDSRATQPDQGPLLRLTGENTNSHLREVLAAAEAMA